VTIGQFANQLLAKGIELAVRKSGRLYVWPKFEAATRTGALITSLIGDSTFCGVPSGTRRDVWRFDQDRIDRPRERAGRVSPSHSTPGVIRLSWTKLTDDHVQF
jgi:hypothetical protein